MTSVVIAAHNEAAVIGRCLDTLLADAKPGEFDITVVANGCSDQTAAVAASRPGVRVLDLATPGKPGALNAGDEVAVGFPRVYLDADIVLTTAGLRLVAAAVADQAPGAPLAAVPRRELDLTGRPMLVRGYFAINKRLPVFQDGLFGRGVIALSAAARARFDRFPDLVADDLFLDSQYSKAEKRQVDTVTARIATPRRTRDLIRRLTRVRRGNAAMRAASGTTVVPVAVRPAARTSWLRDVVLPRPWLAPAAVCYVAITVLAAFSARRAGQATAWERDDSSRQEELQTPSGRHSA
ncbi:glycosyltransferase [Phytohabitans kaempferiae]|uniref:4,4'-diaponeurosporenoate glycosyltransferase n=1 Tax=Phytohabitans kaempferiae TaxID=1620943 RepID=A0ABV6MCS6_9ACTN